MNQETPSFNRTRIALATLACLALSVTSFLALSGIRRDRDQKKLESMSKNIALAIQREIDLNLESVRGVANHFRSGAPADRESFRKFTRETLRRHSDIQALEWMLHFAGRERDRMEKILRSEGFPDLRITELDPQGHRITAPKRSEYSVITFVEPLAGNEAALGYNVLGVPEAVEAIERARRFEVGVSDWLPLAQGDLGFVVYLPVRHDGAPPRRKYPAKEEFAVGVFRLSHLIETSLADLENPEVDFTLVEFVDDQEGPRSFRYEGVLRKLVPAPTPIPAQTTPFRIATQETIEVGTRRWLLKFTPSAEFQTTLPPTLPWGTSLAIILIGVTGILFLDTFRQKTWTQSANSELRAEILRHQQTEAERQRLLALEQKARREAELAMKTSQEFLSIASHELRTPITPLKILVSLLKRHFSNDSSGLFNREQFRAALEDSERQLDGLNRLVQDLLFVSQISNTPLHLHPREFRLEAFLLALRSRIEPELIRSACQLNITVPPDVTVQWDYERMEQALLKLLFNAVKFGPGQPIELGAETEGEGVRITLRDRGIGIPPDKLSRIFERFERGVPSSSYGGLGLGLYLTRTIIEAHGGRISVESQENNGSTFTLWIPVTAAKPDPS